ncbi:MAG: methionyl-tRNA formyltransferase [Clostridiales bacterium]|nr:methionyl-tRNA formyltransferase [Clostridiales bacterium]
MRVVFMGTPDFAVPVLSALAESRHEVCAVVTQPDKPRGRGKNMQFPPVKEKAQEYGIPVYQPVRVKELEFVITLRELAPDMIVVVAFGQILSKDILDIPKYGCVNVHASLLPKYRGAAPIQWVILDGEEKTGITTMLMDVGLDTGDMLEKVEVEIAPDETGGSLHDKLASKGGALLLSTLDKIEAGSIVRTKQDDSQSCYAKILTKDMGKIDFSKSAVVLERQIRGLNPWPSAYCTLDGKTMKIWRAQIEDENSSGTPGLILSADKRGIRVQTGQGILCIKELQMEGKKRMDSDAFLRGYPMKDGMILL